MFQLFRRRLQALQQTAPKGLLSHNKVGLEKESLRVAANGKIAQTPHPKKLGSAFTHPYITTDYSEALLEFVTPAFQAKSEVLSFLRECQAFVYQSMEGELLWATSMPCVVAGETSIPIASYGSSNLGMMKTVYRRGLGHRYGRVMQVIAGVHYNFSFSDDFWEWFREFEQSELGAQAFNTEYYFRVIRNLQRVGWLMPYLFGASPAVCKSFLNGQATDMLSFNESTYFYPYATSLRMGDIGYQNNIEKGTGIKVNYDSLENYIQSLRHAITTSYPPYEKIGIKNEEGFQQLNSNLLQIENEYYSTVRPKQICEALEMPTNALRSRGVAYIEVRSLDVNAFDPMGIHEKALSFLETLVFSCLLHPSLSVSEEEQKKISANILKVAHNGREPGLRLWRGDDEVELKQWAQEIFSDLADVAEVLDDNTGTKVYSQAVQYYLPRVMNADETPSARMLTEMRDNKEGFFNFALRKSEEYNEYFKSYPLSEERRRFYLKLAEESLQKQAQIEAGDTLDFAAFLNNYFSRNLGTSFRGL